MSMRVEMTWILTQQMMLEELGCATKPTLRSGFRYRKPRWVSRGTKALEPPQLLVSRLCRLDQLSLEQRARKH